MATGRNANDPRIHESCVAGSRHILLWHPSRGTLGSNGSLKISLRHRRTWSMSKKSSRRSQKSGTALEIAGAGCESIKPSGYMWAVSQSSVLAKAHCFSSRSPARAEAFEGRLVGTSVQVEVQESVEEEEDDDDDDDPAGDWACTHCKGRDIESVSSESKYAWDSPFLALSTSTRSFEMSQICKHAQNGAETESLAVNCTNSDSKSCRSWEGMLNTSSGWWITLHERGRRCKKFGIMSCCDEVWRCRRIKKISYEWWEQRVSIEAR